MRRPSTTIGGGTNGSRRHRPVPVSSMKRRLFMQWTTPAATDFRFGFEICLYVAAR